MPWPGQIRWFSLPSLVFSVLFFWNGAVYLNFAVVFRRYASQFWRYLFFGLTCLSLSLYSMGNFFQYNSENSTAISFWLRFQFIALIFFFIFFVFFMLILLKIPFRPWRVLLTLLSLGFLPTIFRPGWFFSEQSLIKHIQIGSFSTSIFEVGLGPFGDLFLTMCTIVLCVFSFLLIRHRREYRHRHVVPMALGLFIATALNDMMVIEGFYNFFYLLEVGFFGYIVAIAFSLFRDYVDANQRLLFQSAQIKKLNDEMKFLLTSLSHDLSAPLVSIKGFISLFEDGIPTTPEEKAHYFRRIRVNADSMTAMIENIVHFLRIGRVDWKPEIVDLKALIEEALEVFSEKGKNSAVRIDFPERFPQLRSSASYVRIILMNLIQNALKYAPTERKEIKVSCEPWKQGLTISVSNPGRAISPELAERIFSPFSRGESAIPGMGLGLAIVKKAAASLGGEVWLDRQYQNGVRFCVYIPSQEE